MSRLFLLGVKRQLSKSMREPEKHKPPGLILYMPGHTAYSIILYYD